MADLLYSGGPCSGKHETIPDDFTATRISCGGATYNIYQVQPHYWLGLPPGARAPQTVVTPSSPKAARAWAHLVRTIVSGVPADLRASQASRRRMLRAARR